jgi:hypothetical protein
MTAATITRPALAAVAVTPAEAEVISGARAVLAAVRSDDFPWPCRDSAAITMCAEALADCLDEHVALRKGWRHPESVFPDLGRHQDDALAVALGRVTQDIGKWAGAVVVTVRDKCGVKAAEYVSGAAPAAGGEGQ